MNSICVFCGSSPGRGEEYVEMAKSVGEILAREKIRLVYGGGSVGLMGAVADACLASGGEVIGVITEGLLGLEVGHRGCTELIVVPTMLERKTRMAELSDGFLSLPGGIGTLDEMFEMLTWSQLDIHQKPSALLNFKDYYAPLLALLDRMCDDRFLLREHIDMLLVGTEPEAILDEMRSFEAKPVEKWVERQTNGKG